jgi:hypothetical protein
MKIPMDHGHGGAEVHKDPRRTAKDIICWFIVVLLAVACAIGVIGANL